MIFGHRHRYDPVAVEHTTAGPFVIGIAQTIVLRRCRCGALDAPRLDGTWELHQVRGETELRLAEASEEMLPQVKR